MAMPLSRIGPPLACLAIFGAVFSPAGDAPVRPSRPSYTPDGKLELPGGYRTWVFVGANLSPEYRTEAEQGAAPPPDRRKARAGDQFHHVYINPESYAEFRKSGKFPDPTILILEIFRAETRDAKGVLSGGQVEGERTGLSAAVKDARRPGGGVPWAYYSFDVKRNPTSVKPSAAHADKECYACHLEHASNDNVWVQFYPALRDRE
jgi:hypothetical protein